MSARDDDLRQELTCPICMELFRNPVSLVPCQHTFCELCIVSVLQAGATQQQAHCPVCRTVTEMACQCHLARNASAILATAPGASTLPGQYEHVPATGLRAFARAPTGKRKAIFQIDFNLYPYETLSFYGPDHAAEMADALSRNATIRTVMFCELGSMHSRFIVAAMCVTKLSLCHCALTDSNALEIGDMLTVNSVLTKLALDENGIGDAGLTHIANALCQNTALVKLSMNSNCVREAGVLALGAACSRQCALRSISLLENSLTPLAVSELARAVAGNTVLAALQLSWCVVSAHEVGALRHWHATSQANSTLESLSLLRTPLLPSQCLDRGSALLDKHALTALNLNHCSLQPPDMPYVARFLADNAVLLTLDVSENNMLDAGASELASALRQNTKLRTLALRDNDVTAPGLQSIFDAVRTNSTLVSLDLCINHLGSLCSAEEDLGAACAARDMLTENQTITHLFMDYVTMSPKQGSILAQGVANNFSLKRFTFSGTDFSDSLRL